MDSSLYSILDQKMMGLYVPNFLIAGRKRINSELVVVTNNNNAAMLPHFWSKFTHYASPDLH